MVIFNLPKRRRILSRPKDGVRLPVTLAHALSGWIDNAASATELFNKFSSCRSSLWTILIKTFCYLSYLPRTRNVDDDTILLLVPTEAKDSDTVPFT